MALACDRIYHLALPGDAARAPKIVVGEANFGVYPMVTGQSRLGDGSMMRRRRWRRCRATRPAARRRSGVCAGVTSIPDDIDWDDETRIAIEERVSMSPDALTAMEANLRFDGPETFYTRVFGRLTAWQNWIFQRPERGRRKGRAEGLWRGRKAAFDWNRV